MGGYMFRFRLVVVAITLSVLAGCATVNPMAFDKTSKSIDTSKKSILLMTIDVSRSDDSRYVPHPTVVYFEKPNAQSQEERQNFRISEGTDSLQVIGKTIYLARMALEPGKYQLVGIGGMANVFPFIGGFLVPLVLDVSVQPNSIAYVGRVTAKLRERKGDEFRAGPVIPLIDPSVTGMSDGTWDITVNDNQQEDIHLFQANYPVLSTSTIVNSILPSFNRAVAQRWWETDGKPDQQKNPDEQKPTAASGTQTSQAN
jgi:hypothetical protein